MCDPLDLRCASRSKRSLSGYHWGYDSALCALTFFFAVGNVDPNSVLDLLEHAQSHIPAPPRACLAHLEQISRTNCRTGLYLCGAIIYHLWTRVIRNRRSLASSLHGLPRTTSHNFPRWKWSRIEARQHLAAVHLSPRWGYLRCARMIVGMG